MTDSSTALLTDLYQLTMAFGYGKTGIGQRDAVFHLFARSHPFEGGCTVSCGQDTGEAIEVIDPSDASRLRGFSGEETREPLLRLALEGGRRLEPGSVIGARDHARDQLARLPARGRSGGGATT